MQQEIKQENSFENCILLPISEVGKTPDLIVELKEFEKIDKGTFSRAYMAYIIKT